MEKEEKKDEKFLFLTTCGSKSFFMPFHFKIFEFNRMRKIQLTVHLFPGTKVILELLKGSDSVGLVALAILRQLALNLPLPVQPIGRQVHGFLQGN